MDTNPAKIKLLSVHDAHDPSPLSWDEQILFFNKLPEHLRQMAVFKVNTGCREQEICQLKWKWEIRVPKLSTSVFIIPSHVVKQGKRQQLVKNPALTLLRVNRAEEIESESLMDTKWTQRQKSSNG